MWVWHSNPFYVRLQGLLELVAPIFGQMTLGHGPLLNLFQLCSHLTTDLGPLLSFRAFSLVRAPVSSMQSSNFVPTSLGPRSRRFAAVPSASARLLHGRALARTSCLGSCTAADTRPVMSETCLLTNSDIAFCYHSKSPYMGVIL